MQNAKKRLVQNVKNVDWRLSSCLQAAAGLRYTPRLPAPFGYSVVEHLCYASAAAIRNLIGYILAPQLLYLT